MTPRHILLRSLALAFALLPAGAVAPDAAPLAPAEAKACAGANAGPDRARPAQLARSVVCLVNKVRARSGARPVRLDRSLRRAARGHNDHMLRLECFSHLCPRQPKLRGRVARAGYLRGARAFGFGETIACQGTPRLVVAAWRRSRQHRAIMLDPMYRDLGIALRRGAPTAGCTFAQPITVTSVFGFRR